MSKPVYLMLFVAFGSAAWAQSNIQIPMTVSLLDDGVDCLGTARRVIVLADLTDVVGNGGEEAGLNAFCVSLAMDSGDFLSAVPGGDTMDWMFSMTLPTLANSFEKVVVVGAQANPYASARLYHVATLLFGGREGPLQVDLQPSETSFGSRVVPVTGDGPGPIPFAWTQLGEIALPGPGQFDLRFGCSLWGFEYPDYDFVAPYGEIDMLDLAKLVSCTRH